MKETRALALVDIRTRTFKYSLRAIKLYRYVQCQKDGVGWVLGKQFLRSATSIGANLQEAKSAESPADFVHKYGLAQKEARESLYWLELLAESAVVPRARVIALIEETDEILSVITTTIIKLKRKAAKHA